MSPQLHAFALDVLRLVVWLALLAVIFAPLERLFTLRRPLGRLKDVPADIGFYFLNSLLPLAILAPPLALFTAGLRLVTPEAYVAAVAALPLWAKLAAAFAVSELGGYWGHRWCHEVPWLWRFHVLHHAPEHIDWLVSPRAHPVDQIFEKLCAIAPLYILGLVQPTPQGAGLAAYIAIFGTIWGFFIHANVRWRLGPLEWLVSTPAFHHWHHTNDEHRDHNYAALFPVVDRLFGTHYLPRHWPPVYGVDAPQPPSMAEQILRPLGFGVRAPAPAPDVS
ncbi:sterol desaturase family protein [Phenylobacterium sp.]|uniref:sterol desaturase family protein n=1 Tax=Phenylobacterium sp. TaxID=1871053 RepID=UPI0025DABFC1|nr:sterol desaturase family protein [Phenylobacterium sp.]